MAESLNLSALEDRLKRAFGVRGAFPVDLLQQISPSVNVFDADGIGYHSWQGKCFAGSHTIVAGVGSSKLCVIPPYPVVLYHLSMTNLAGAAGTFTLRGLSAAEASGMGGVLSQNTFWTEGAQLATYAAEDTGITTRAEAAAAALAQPPLWRGVIPALTTIQLNFKIALQAGVGLCCQDDTVAQGIAFAWQGYVL